MIDEEFLKKNIIELLGLQDLPEARQAAIIMRIANLAQDRIVERVAESIPKDQSAKVEKLADAADLDALRAFVQQYVDIEAVTKEEVLKLKEELQDVAHRGSTSGEL